MEMISSLFDLFFDIIDVNISAAQFLLYLLLSAFVFAVIFNIVHLLMGGD